MLTTTEMKAFVLRHFDDFVNRKDPTAADRNFASDFIDHDGPGHQTVGVAADKQMMQGMYRQFPDLHVEIDDIIAENDRVVCRNTWRGTDAMTGQRVVFTGIVIWRFANEKIVERWASLQPPKAG